MTVFPRARLWRALSRSAVAAAVTTAAVAATPGVADAAVRGVTVRVLDASGSTVLHTFTTNVDTNDFTRFAVAGLGFNDGGSGDGNVAIDDLVVTDLSGNATTYAFTTPPTIVESTTGGTNDVLRYDVAGQRLLGVANSGWTCPSNYESVDLGTSVKKARFTVRRTTGDTGDGSFWAVAAGLVTSNSEAIVSASCAGGAATGMPDNFAGVVYDGDGDGVRNKLYGYGDGSSAATQYNGAVNTTYVVEVEQGAAGGNAAPTIPLHVAPFAGQVWKQSQAQLFAVRSTDPDGNPYQADITVRSASTNAVVATFTTGRASSGTNATGSPATPLAPGLYKWTAVAYDDFGGTSGTSVATSFRVNAAPTAVTQLNPPAGKAFSADEAQTFTATATDPDASDSVRAAITVKDAVTGATVTTFSTPFGASGSTLSASPPSPLPAGSYTWSAQAFDIFADSSAATGTRPFSVKLASEECTTGTTVTDGYADGVYTRLRVTRADADTYWVCWRVDNNGAVRNGGRFVVDGASVTGTPVVDGDADACSTTSGNLLPPASVIRGSVGDPADPAYLTYAADGYLATGKAAVCLSLGDADGAFLEQRVLIPVPEADVPATRLVQDSPGSYRPAPVEQPAYASGDCQDPAVGTGTQLVNAAVTTGSVWLATWQESASRVHVCVRSAGGVNRGGRLTVDTGASGFTPTVGTGTDTTACDRSIAAVSSGPAPFELARSAATNPATVCVTVGSTRLAVRVGASGSLVPPTVTWTPDSGIV